MTFDKLHAAMLRLARKFSLRTNYGLFGQRRRSQIESVAHELAHSVDLVGRPMPSHAIARAVAQLGDRAADQHEMRAQRIEVLALRALGVRVSARDLAAHTEWRGRRGWSRDAISAPLTKREARGVAMFLAVVLAEAGEL